MSKGKILIADDEQHIQELLEMIFEEEGYEVVTASDGAEAVEKAKSELPDAIIMDIMMPKLDGYQAFHSLRDDPATATIPVLILTAKSESIYDRISKGIGASDHITKPFDPAEVVEKIESMIKGDL